MLLWLKVMKKARRKEILRKNQRQMNYSINKKIITQKNLKKWNKKESKSKSRIRLQKQ